MSWTRSSATSLPTKLVEFTGQMLNIHVYDDQEVMFVDRDTGEVAYEDAPLLLPGVAGE